MTEQRKEIVQRPIPAGQGALEAAILATMIRRARPENAAALESQVATASVVFRDITGAGFYTDFDVPAVVPRLPPSKLGGIAHVVLEDDGLYVGARFSDGAIATFMLGISMDQQGGLLRHLEGQMLEVEPWPSDVSKFEIVE